MSYARNTDLVARHDCRNSPLSRFMREQRIGLCLGVFQFCKLARRLAQLFAGSTLVPWNWVRAFRVLTNEELKRRALLVTADPTVDVLLRWGAFSPCGIEDFQLYGGGNLNPANWARSLAKIGHEWLFGPGGADQRARIYVADLIAFREPSVREDRVAQLVNDQFGRYEQKAWTGAMCRAARFVLLPGWDFSSVVWVIRHPVRTIFPTAVILAIAVFVVGWCPMSPVGLARSISAPDMIATVRWWVSLWEAWVVVRAVYFTWCLACVSRPI